MRNETALFALDLWISPLAILNISIALTVLLCSSFKSLFLSSFRTQLWKIISTKKVCEPISRGIIRKSNAIHLNFDRTMQINYMRCAIYGLTFLTYTYSGYGSNIIYNLRDAIIAAEAVFGDVFKNVIHVARKFQTVHQVFDAAVEETCVFKCAGGKFAYAGKLTTWERAVGCEPCAADNSFKMLSRYLYSLYATSAQCVQYWVRTGTVCVPCVLRIWFIFRIRRCNTATQ